MLLVVNYMNYIVLGHHNSLFMELCLRMEYTVYRIPQIICNVYRDKHMINQRIFGFLHIKISPDIEVPSKPYPENQPMGTKSLLAPIPLDPFQQGLKCLLLLRPQAPLLPFGAVADQRGTPGLLPPGWRHGMARGWSVGVWKLWKMSAKYVRHGSTDYIWWLSFVRFC